MTTSPFSGSCTLICLQLYTVVVNLDLVFGVLCFCLNCLRKCFTGGRARALGPVRPVRAGSTASPWVTEPSASALLGCEVVLRLVPGLTASDPPVSGSGWLPSVFGLFVLKMSVYDNIDPAHLYPLFTS